MCAWFSSWEGRKCFYRHKVGHVIADCAILKAKGVCQHSNKQHKAGMSLLNKALLPVGEVQPDEVEPAFQPFILVGTVSVTSGEENKIKILWDAGVAQTVILADVLPLSNEMSCHAHVLLQGIEMGLLKTPLHNNCLQTDLVTCSVRVGVCEQLPVRGVSMILGNDLAGGKVTPLCEVSQIPELTDGPAELAKVFPECAITRAQSRKCKDMVDLEGTFLTSIKDDRAVLESPIRQQEKESRVSEKIKIQPTYKQLVLAQQSDESLMKCFVEAQKSSEEVEPRYVLIEEVLVQRLFSRRK